MRMLIFLIGSCFIYHPTIGMKPGQNNKSNRIKTMKHAQKIADSKEEIKKDKK